jgi:ribonuclease J
MDARRPRPDVARTIVELIASSPARVAVTTFASNVARLRAVADGATAADREVVVVGRAMERVVQVARETGYLDGVRRSSRGPMSTATCRRQGGGTAAPAARANRAPRLPASPRDDHPHGIGTGDS